jgi:hypothetical protein
MAKKTHSSRTGAARRPITTSPMRANQPALINQTSTQTNEEKAKGTATIVAPRPQTPATQTASARPLTAKKTTPSTTSATTGKTPNKQAIKAANQMMRRNTIKAENFAYALKDLKFIAIVAGIMFVFMIVLRIFLPPGTLVFFK